jgi:OFA family oxalate/formate antiporter-like MFS transporter
MSEGTDFDARAREVLGFSRWWLVVAAVLMMAVVSPYQYVWTAIETPIQQRLGVSEASIGLVFTLFVVFQAGCQVPVGWWRDRHGPRGLTAVAAVLAGGGYIGLAAATEVWQVYLLYSLGAIGVGIVYTVAVNTALKWFPDRRGLTTGAGTMAFAAGSAVAVPFVRAAATPTEYATVLRPMGVLIGVVVLGGALVLRDPPTGWREAPDAAADGGGLSGYRPREVLRTRQFWLMYGMFVAMSGAGLMLTAKVVQFATHYDLAAVVVPLGWLPSVRGPLTLDTVTLSAMFLPLAGGVGRLVVGDLSDRVDRRRAMAVSFTLCGLGLLGVVGTGLAGASVAFVLAVVVATFFWSPQYTLFPAVVGDFYGERHSSANYAMLYSAKVWGGVFGGTVAGWLATTTDWATTGLIGGALALAAGVAALFLAPPEPP